MCKPKPEEKIMTVEDGNLSVFQLIHTAIGKLDGEGSEAVVSAIERLVELEDRVDRRNSEKEFYRELADFQAECPQIKKTSSSKKSATKEGGKFGYNYAELDEIQKTIKPLLYKRGFSFSWDTETVFENNNPIINCTCYLRHRNGHLTKASFSVPINRDVGSMNEVQRHSAVKTYIKRQTLVDVLGLTTTENDTDGSPPSELLTKDQVATIKKTITDFIPPSAVPRFLKLFKIEKVEDLSQNDYEFALQKLAEFKAKYADK